MSQGATGGRWPQKGDRAVDLRLSQSPIGRDAVGPEVTIVNITQTMVVTSDGERYNRTSLRPLAGGPHSPRVLVPLHDRRALTARARTELAAAAGVVTNLTRVEHRTPEQVYAALTQAIVAVDNARRQVVRLMATATRNEQEA